MGTVTELFVIMFIVAGAAFVPLGYFIYKYTQSNGQPFGDTAPHGDSPSVINDLAENAIRFVQSRLAKK
ncbi:hypothetical protein [Methylovulum psychrotolerans]|jgi:hypothetical protein|uniref:Uncharacterized protein n=1 Tax=Methylovulum psychrotolerans TaxID=1704499 RepID=A0A1Z4BUJ9_9GAMM|nr:hypothetical protein [Methylovulum psychrotolerans]ASF44920.1 hypothetical protein CEK71_01910 [Methylovulum psychrotolerans]MBT9098283.1 hypothetical protein [Methylovulum psychrotolerans]POZ53991.1 hypothetical protein AADEFJLK_01033 [Methylovulum psychrotolerans]